MLNITLNIFVWIAILFVNNLALIFILCHKKDIGTMEIDRRNSDRDIFRFKFGMDPNDIRKTGYYRIKVDVNADLSELEDSQ